MPSRAAPGADPPSPAMPQPIDQFAARLPADKRASVYQSTKTTHEKRTRLLFDQFGDPDRLRRLAGDIKQHAIENLDTYLPQVEQRLRARVAMRLEKHDEPFRIERARGLKRGSKLRRVMPVIIYDADPMNSSFKFKSTSSPPESAQASE